MWILYWLIIAVLSFLFIVALSVVGHGIDNDEGEDPFP
jgi:putative copper export protein